MLEKPVMLKCERWTCLRNYSKENGQDKAGDGRVGVKFESYTTNNMYIYIIYITSYPRHVGFKWFRKILQEFWRKLTSRLCRGRWGVQPFHWKIHWPDLRIHAQHTAEAHLLSVIATVLLQHLLGDQLPCSSFWKNSTSLGALRIFESLFERIELSKRTGSRNLSEALTPLLLVFLVPHAKVIKFHNWKKVCIVSDDSTYNPHFWWDHQISHHKPLTILPWPMDMVPFLRFPMMVIAWTKTLTHRRFTPWTPLKSSSYHLLIKNPTPPCISPQFGHPPPSCARRSFSSVRSFTRLSPRISCAPAAAPSPTGWTPERCGRTVRRGARGVGPAKCSSRDDHLWRGNGGLDGSMEGVVMTFPG